MAAESKEQLQLRLMGLAETAPPGESPDPAKTRRPPELVQEPPERRRKWFGGAYILAPRSVLESDLPSMAQLVYFALASWSTNRGTAWPSLSAIARRINCDRSCVRRNLRVLVAAGWVTRERRRVAGVHDTTVYQLLDPGEGGGRGTESQG